MTGDFFQAEMDLVSNREDRKVILKNGIRFEALKHQSNHLCQPEYPKTS